MDESIEGVMRIEVESLSCKTKNSYMYIYRGNFNSAKEDILQKASQRQDCSNEIINTFEYLFNIPDVDEGLVKGSNEILRQYLSDNILEKFNELSKYVACDIQKRKTLFDICGKTIAICKDSEIYDKSKCYTINLPQNYTPMKKYPLLVYFNNAPGIPDTLYYVKKGNFTEAIILNINGNYNYNDYIEDIWTLDIVRRTAENLNIDMERIYIMGYCAGVLSCFNTALKLPGLAAGLVLVSGVPEGLSRMDYLKNIQTTSIYNLCNIDDFFVPEQANLEMLKELKKLKNYVYCNFSHNDFNEIANSRELLKSLIQEKKDRYPKKISFTVYEPMYNRYNWIVVDYIEDLNSKAFINADILSDSLIDIYSENIAELRMYIDKQRMGLSSDVEICVNHLKKKISLKDYSEINILIHNDCLNVEVSNMSEEEFHKEYDFIGIDETLLGLKQLYLEKCIIVKPNSFKQGTEPFVKEFSFHLSNPMTDSTKAYKYAELFENEVNSEMLSQSNFICVIDMKSASEFQQDIMHLAGINAAKDGISYEKQEFSGDYFALVKCRNPYCREKYALVLIYNSDDVKAEMLNMIKSFDSSSLFYNDTVIFNNNNYYTFRNHQNRFLQTKHVDGEQ
jgi:dienelactone hydrolase